MKRELSKEPLFELGQTVATPGALEALAAYGAGTGYNARVLLFAHTHGDFGEVDSQDWRANEDAIKNGGRILSSYKVGNAKIWVMTEAVGDDGKRASTCILLPEEY